MDKYKIITECKENIRSLYNGAESAYTQRVANIKWDMAYGIIQFVTNLPICESESSELIEWWSNYNDKFLEQVQKKPAQETT